MLVRIGAFESCGTREDWCFRDLHNGGLWEDDLFVCALAVSGMDIVLLKVSVVVPKSFDTGTTRPYLVRDTSYHSLGHLASSFEMDFNSSVCFFQTHVDMFYH